MVGWTSISYQYAMIYDLYWPSSDKQSGVKMAKTFLNGNLFKNISRPASG